MIDAIERNDLSATLDFYETFVTLKMHQANLDDKNYGFLGLAGETGEVIDLWKKVYHGKPMNYDKLKEEMGDVLFYFFLVLMQNNLTFEDVLEGNVDKLNKRYPEGADNGRED